AAPSRATSDPDQGSSFRVFSSFIVEGDGWNAGSRDCGAVNARTRLEQELGWCEPQPARSARPGPWSRPHVLGGADLKLAALGSAAHPAGWCALRVAASRPQNCRAVVIMPPCPWLPPLAHGHAHSRSSLSNSLLVPCR